VAVQQSTTRQERNEFEQTKPDHLITVFAGVDENIRAARQQMFLSSIITICKRCSKTEELVHVLGNHR
jgi:ribosome-binding protein aMBF1 (putative translation factor)